MTESTDSMTAHTISSEGLTLAVWEGPDHGPPIVFVHGFPDTHVVWTRVIDRLSDRFRCIAYDIRGAGASDAPAATADYSTPHLVTDLAGVLDGFAADRPVHLVGHDWGSVQTWDAVLREPTDERLTGRIASFTSISGPSLDHLRTFPAAARRGGPQLRRQALEQAVRSWYVLAFQVPVLPEVVLRRLGHRIFGQSDFGPDHFAPTLPRDAANGLHLYRANLRRRPAHPGGLRTSVPVQLVVPLRDIFVLPALASVAETFATDLIRLELDAGHWVPRSHPDELARCIAAFVTDVEARRGQQR
jgi:pimeloyl-ACP methyl ester carboxylesterase